MLSLSPIKASAPQASAYYLSEEKDLHLSELEFGDENQKEAPNGNILEKTANYYLASREDHQQGSQWMGKLADSLSLSGKPVDQALLEEVLSGYADGEAIKHRRPQHRPGHDLTFSAPKSVSVMALVFGDTRLLEAHDQAVKTALSEIEKNTAQIKLSKRGGEDRYENTDNLMFATVRHKTSRENEPQLHTHALLANMTRTDDGSIKPLATCMKQKNGVVNGTFERIYANQKYFGMLYQSELAKQVQEAGYAIKGVGKGMFEIEAVPESLMKDFSTRRAQILAQTEAMGLDSANAMSVAARDTRQKKSFTPEANLMHDWQSTTKTHGFDGLGLVASTYENPKSNETAPDLSRAHKALDLAIGHFSRFNTKLQYEKLIEKTAEGFTSGDFLNIREIKAAMDEKLKAGELIPLNKEKSAFTTQNMVQGEQQLIQSADRRSNDIRATINKTSLSQLNLNADSEKVVNSVLGTDHQISVINLQGSGQQISEALLHVGTESGQRMRFITPNNSVRQDTAKSVKRRAFTAWQWMKNVVRNEHVQTLHQFTREEQKLGSRDVLVIEQSNKLDRESVQHLIDQAVENNSKLIFLNKEGGQKGVQAGNVMDILQKANVNQELWRNTHQKTDTRVTIRESDIKSKNKNMIEQYTIVYNQDKKDTQILTHSKQRADVINQDVREQLQRQGEISRQGVEIETTRPVFLTPEQKSQSTNYQQGMLLTEWQDQQKSIFTVLNSSKQANTVTLADEQGNKTLIELNNRRHKGRISRMMLSEVRTTEVAQGDILRSLSGLRLGEQRMEQNSTLTVDKVNRWGVVFKDSDDNKIQATHDQLHRVPLDYAYARTVHQANPDASRLLIEMPDYAASKEMMNELVSGEAKEIAFFTNDSDKLERKLKTTAVQPSAIQRVMQTDNSIDKYLNTQTPQTLLNDVNKAVEHIQALHNNQNTLTRAVDHAISKITERQAAFSHVELVKEAISYAMGEENVPITQGEIDQRLNTLQQEGNLLSAEYSDGTRWTTSEALSTEKTLLGRFSDGRNTLSPMATPEQSKNFLDNNDRLTNGQKEAIHLITTSSDQYIAIQGFAGTGKSTMLAQGIELAKTAASIAPESQSPRFIGLAPTHSAVKELQEKGVEAQTLASLLQSYDNREILPEQHKGVTFILDESSMVSNAQAEKFTHRIEQSGARAIFLGDKHQLTSIEAGKPFELALQRGIIPSANMNDIVRQKNETLLGAVHQIIDKEMDGTLAALKQQKTLSEDQYQTQSVLNQHQLSINKSHNVISTFNYKPLTNDPNKEPQTPVDALYKLAADEYLARTPESRDNTLMIAYSNRERDHLADLIREGLQGQGALDTNQKDITRLRSMGVEKAMLNTMLPYEKGMIMSIGGDQYYRINKVDKSHELLEVTDLNTMKDKALYPKNTDHAYTSLWRVEKKPLAAGDQIMWRVADKEKGFKGNEPMTLKSIDDGQMILEKTDKTIATVALDDVKSGHWDYRYTRTADMAQGATYKNVISVIKSSAMLTNQRRAYIDITRASEHVKMFTDNEQKTALSWINNDNDKSSAMDTVEKKTYPQERYFTEEKQHSILDTKELVSSMTPYTESLAQQLLGTPDQATTNRDYLSFTKGDETIKVSLTGEHRGHWKNWTTGDHGNLLSLLMSEKNQPFKEAVGTLREMANAPDKHGLSANPNHEALLDTLPEKASRFQQRAQKYFTESLPVMGSLAEDYVRQFTNNVEGKTAETIRFHPAVYSSETRSSHPAILSEMTDHAGEFKAIEVTYIDTLTGLPASDLEVDKRILGSQTGTSMTLHEGENTQATIIAIGTENGLSLLDKNAQDMDIFSVPRLDNVKSLDYSELRVTVLLCLDSKGISATDKLVEDTIRALEKEGHSVEVTDTDSIENTIDKVTKEQEKIESISTDEKDINELETDAFMSQKTPEKEIGKEREIELSL